MLQRHYKDALDAYEEARQRFTQLDEPGTVAVVWHQTGMAYQAAGQPEAAEDAYRKALAIKVRLGDVAGQASTLGQLGNLYDDVLNRPEEAVAFYRQAADKYVEGRNAVKEGVTRSNVAETLRKLARFDEARQEIRRAIECKAQSGHTAEPWKTWAILADIETDAGNPLPPQRRRARPSPATSPTAATAAKTTMTLAAYFTPWPRRSRPAKRQGRTAHRPVPREMEELQEPRGRRPASHRRRQPRPSPSPTPRI